MPAARPSRMVRASRARIASAVTSSMDGSGWPLARSALAAALPGLGVQVSNQPRLVIGVAIDALDQRRVGGNERQVEQLRIGFLFQVYALLLVALELRRAFDGVEGLAQHEGLLEHVVDVDVEMSVGAARSCGRFVHANL